VLKLEAILKLLAFCCSRRRSEGLCVVSPILDTDDFLDAGRLNPLPIWAMSVLREPLSFTRAEWQQAKRIGLDPKELKAVFRKAWESSGNRAAFEQALAERGFVLAQGDRRAFVAVDYRGEVYGIARKASVKVKEVASKLGDPSELPSVETVKAEIAARMTGKIREFIEKAEKDAQRRMAFIDFRKAEVVGRHIEERRALGEDQEKRWQAETLERAARLPKGMAGIWHRLTGRYAKVKAQNERETLEALHRDSDEKDALIMRQLEERQALEREIRAQREAAQEELLQLREDVASYMELDRMDQTRSRKIERDGDGDDGPRPRPPCSRRRRSFDP